MLRKAVLLRTRLVVVTAVLSVCVLDAAFPRLVMVYGGSLDRPIVMEGIVDAFSPSPKDIQTHKPSAGRPYFELALFWGPAWSQYVKDGRPLDQLRPEDARTTFLVPTDGRFYPACGDAPAVIVSGLTSGQRTWRVSASGLEAFQRSGVPVSVDCSPK